MDVTWPKPIVMSVTEAAARGLPALVKAAERGGEILVERRGTAVAAVVGIQRLEQLQTHQDDLTSIAVVLTRLATDSGQRVGLDEAMSEFGLDRSDLEAELDAELDQEREASAASQPA